MKTELRLKVARAALGWSQEQLAVASGVHSWIISAYERGRRKLRHDEQLKIAIVLV